jgi:hypothetical protein
MWIDTKIEIVGQSAALPVGPSDRCFCCHAEAGSSSPFWNVLIWGGEGFGEGWGEGMLGAVCPRCAGRPDVTDTLLARLNEVLKSMGCRPMDRLSGPH